MSGDEERILISGRVGTQYDDLRAPGSITAKCAKCSHAVWLAPTSLPLNYKKVFCNVCVNASPEILGALAEGKILPVPGQDEEFKEVTGTLPPTREQIREHYKRKLEE